MNCNCKNLWYKETAEMKLSGQEIRTLNKCKLRSNIKKSIRISQTYKYLTGLEASMNDECPFSQNKNIN